MGKVAQPFGAHKVKDYLEAVDSFEAWLRQVDEIEDPIAEYREIAFLLVMNNYTPWRHLDSTRFEELEFNTRLPFKDSVLRRAIETATIRGMPARRARCATPAGEMEAGTSAEVVVQEVGPTALVVVETRVRGRVSELGVPDIAVSMPPRAAVAGLAQAVQNGLRPEPLLDALSGGLISTLR